jgi:hypothetical protein
MQFVALIEIDSRCRGEKERSRARRIRMNAAQESE